MLPVLADEAGPAGGGWPGTPIIPRLAQPGQPALYIQLRASTAPPPDVEGNRERERTEGNMMEQDIQEILFPQEALARRVKELAGEIRRGLRRQGPLVVGGSPRAALSLWPTWCGSWTSR